MAQADNSWQRETRREVLPIMLNLLCFPFEQQNNSPSPTGDVEGLVRGVQHQNIAHRIVKENILPILTQLRELGIERDNAEGY